MLNDMFYVNAHFVMLLKLGWDWDKKKKKKEI